MRKLTLGERRGARGLVLFAWIALLFLRPVGAVETAGPQAAAARMFASRLKSGKGICVTLGCGDANMALALAAETDMLIRCVDPDEATVGKARRAIDAAGLYGARISAGKGKLAPLAYPSCFANLVICGDEFVDGKRKCDFKEVYRILSPNGMAFIGQSVGASKRGQKLDRAQLEGWLKEAGITTCEIVEECGIWACVTRPRPPGADEWTHRLHDPGNTGRSLDEALTLPLKLQWFLAPPPPALGSSITLLAGDRQFILEPSCNLYDPRVTPSIRTLDPYNGTVIWSKIGEKSLPPGFYSLTHYSPDLTCSLAAAASDSLYVLCGEKCARFDAAGGELLALWPIPSEAKQKDKDVWRYMALHGDLLLGVAGPSPRFRPKWYAPGKRGLLTAVFALDRRTGKLLWSTPCNARASSFVVGDARLFFFDSEFHLHCLDLKDGSELFNVRPLEFSPRAGIHYIAYDRERLWMVYGSKGTPAFTNRGNDLAVFSGKDGKFLFSADMTNAVINSIALGVDAVYGRGQHGPKGKASVGWDAETGKRIETPGMAFGGCTPLVTSPRYVLGRALIYDPGAKAMVRFPWVRNTCYYPCIPANGMLYIPGPGCFCKYPLRAFAAMIPGKAAEVQPEDPKTRLVRGGGGEADAFKNPVVWATWRADGARSGRTENAPARPSLKKAWQKKLPGRVAPVAMADATIYCGSTDHHFYALGAEDGSEKWHYLAEGPVSMSPYLAEGRVVFGDGDGWIHCLRARDGTLVWKYRMAPLEDRVILNGELISRWPVATGVLADKGVVYAVSGLVPDAPIAACSLDIGSGELQWEQLYPRSAKKSQVPQGPLVLARGGRALLPPTRGSGGFFISLDDPKHGAKSIFGLCCNRAMAVGDDLLYGEEAIFAYSPNNYVRRFADLPVVTEDVVYLPVYGRSGTWLTAMPRAAFDIKYGRFAPKKGKKGEKPLPMSAPLWEAWKSERMIALILAGKTLFSGGFSITEKSRTQFGVQSKGTKRGTFHAGTDKIYATSAVDGKELWSAEAPGSVRDLAFNNNRLVAVCGPSTVVCFECGQ